jgi:hypothetical protein
MAGFFRDCQFDRAFRNRDVGTGPEKPKPGTGLIDTCGIECQPAVTGPDDMAQMPPIIGERTDRGRIAPYGLMEPCGSCFVDSFDS